MQSLGGVPIGGAHATHAWRHHGIVVEATPLRKSSLYEDLALREFRAFAMAARWPEGTIVDPFDGRRDVWRRRLRMPPESDRFAQDPLRVLRGWRRIAEGWHWAPETAARAAAQAPRLAEVPPERIGPVMLKLLAGKYVRRALMQMQTWPGLLQALHPALAALVQTVPPGNHHFAPWTHTALLAGALPPQPAALRLAALWHDTGKVSHHLASPTPPATRYHLKDHATRSAAMAERVLQQWAIPKQIRTQTIRLIAAHSFTPATLAADAGARRIWLAEHPDLWTALLTFKRADRWSAGKCHRNDDLNHLANAAAQTQNEPYPRRPADLPVDSAALFTELDIRGARRKHLLTALWHWVLADPAHRNCDEAIRRRAAELTTAPRSSTS